MCREKSRLEATRIPPKCPAVYLSDSTFKTVLASGRSKDQPGATFHRNGRSETLYSFVLSALELARGEHGESPVDELAPELVGHLRSGLRLLALRALDDAERAEELAQEALTRTLEALREGRPRDPARFARGVIRNLIGDEYRDRDRRRRLRETDTPRWHSPPLGALDRLVAEERRERVRDALAQLSSPDREVLRLSFYEGLTPAEIADRLDEPGPRIRKRKSRAMDRLRHVFLKMEHPRGNP